jgi:hypothetical protein
MNWLDGWRILVSCMSLTIRSDALRQTVSIWADGKLDSGYLMIAARNHAFAHGKGLLVL